ncbi:MAG: hypothetical protein ACLRSW_15360 [Christensenellaceae bacterium]
MTMGAFLSMARAMAMRWRSPPKDARPNCRQSCRSQFSSFMINSWQPDALAILSTSSSVAERLPLRIFSRTLVEQEVILRDVGDIFVELFERDFADVLASDRIFPLPRPTWKR